MKVSDFVHSQAIPYKTYPLIYRVRIFINRDKTVTAVITDLKEKTMGSITNDIENIKSELIGKGYISENVQIIEHYEDRGYRSDTFDLVYISENNPTNWKKLRLDYICYYLDCEEDEFDIESLSLSRIYHEIEKIRHRLDPFIDIPFSDSNAVLVRRDEIRKNLVSKEALKRAVEARANETEIHKLIQSDLSILGDYFGRPDDEYICFSEFPLNNNYKKRRIDFVVLTGRSRMDVVLVEIKGADYNLINTGSRSNFSAKTNEAVQQLRERTSCIYENYYYFRKYFYEIKAKAETGDKSYSAFIGPRGNLLVDPNKDINVYRVCIGGKSKDDITESRLRHEYERGQSPPIRIESWDSFLNKLQRD